MASRCVARDAQRFRQFGAAESGLRFIASAALRSAATQWGAGRVLIAGALLRVGTALPLAQLRLAVGAASIMHRRLSRRILGRHEEMQIEIACLAHQPMGQFVARGVMRQPGVPLRGAGRYADGVLAIFGRKFALGIA
jgi:hypothetical protein